MTAPSDAPVERGVPAWVSILLAVACVASLLLAMDGLRLFGGQQWLSFIVSVETHYYYGLLALLFPPVFLIFPPTRRVTGAWRWWIDAPLCAAAAACCVFLFINAERILDEGWEFAAPNYAAWVAVCLWVLLLEALRRCAGLTLFALVTVFSLYPLVAEHLPGALQGISTSLTQTAVYHAMSTESILGLPFRAFANLVIGFLLFGVALQRTGGGRFFIDLAFALLGRARGGPAKVAIVSSGLMGSMSGSVITNVLTTGQLTIPAMRRSGFSAPYAAGVEACASTGGVLLPPIMGSTAFVMATFLEVPYSQVALAATIPALLFFIGLYMQVDAYAARMSLHGLQQSEIPSLRKTLAGGWYYIGAFAALIFMLLYMQREAVAPYYATALLLAMNQFSREHRWKWRDAFGFLTSTATLLVELLVVMAGVGLIVGALSLTGLSGTLVNDLLHVADGSIWLLLLMGAMTSFVLGIGMTVTAAYIFLAIVLAPALIQGGLDPMSVHLFILYWGMLSFITPPVALGAFAAASLANAPPIQTGFTAMRLGSVIFFIPFFFVLDTSFILTGTVGQIAWACAQALAGIWLIASGLQGYVAGFGKLTDKQPFGYLSHLFLTLGGIALAFPDLTPAGIPVGDRALWIASGVSVALAWTFNSIGTRRG